MTPVDVRDGKLTGQVDYWDWRPNGRHTLEP